MIEGQVSIAVGTLQFQVKLTVSGEIRHYISHQWT